MNDRNIRVMSLLRELAAEFVAYEANTDPMITITRVTSSPDYRNATIHITTMPAGREDDALIWLKRHATEMRRHIMKKSNLKIIPRFEFSLDFGERHRQHIDDLVRDNGVESSYEDMPETGTKS